RRRFARLLQEVGRERLRLLGRDGRRRLDGRRRRRRDHRRWRRRRRDRGHDRLRLVARRRLARQLELLRRDRANPLLHLGAILRLRLLLQIILVRVDGLVALPGLLPRFADVVEQHRILGELERGLELHRRDLEVLLVERGLGGGEVLARLGEVLRARGGGAGYYYKEGDGDGTHGH